MENLVEVLNGFIGSIWGKLSLGLLIVVLLSVATSVVSSKRKFNTKILLYSALSIALALVLSNIKVFKMPMGGSVTAMSMLFIVIIGYWFGPVQGILCGLTYGVLQLLIDPYVIHPAQLVVDYFLAFGALGLSGFFRKGRFALPMGYLVAVSGRLLFSVLSGYVFFGSYAKELGYSSALLYSFLYNLTYIAPEAIVTLVLISVPAVSHALKLVGKKAVEI